MNPRNYSAISFPNLGLELDPGRSFSIGPLTVHYYGLIIAVGLLLAVLYGCRRGKQFGLKEDTILDGVLWVTPFAIICARIYYCVFSWKEFAADPISVLYIWNGGIAIYGGVLGAIIGVAVFCKIKKLNVFAVLDLVLHSSSVAGESGLEALETTLDTYMRLGGMGLQYSVLSADLLKEAQRNPEGYPNLQVRVCGWNARFTSLSEVEQNEFIRQAEA